MNKFLLILSFAAAMMSVSCEKEQTDIVTSHERAIVIIPPDSPEIVYNLGSSVKIGKLLTWRSYWLRVAIYDQELFDEAPSSMPLKAVVTLDGTYEFKEGEQLEDVDLKKVVDAIVIKGLDSSLGLGEILTIPLDDGEYKGENDLIDFVKINSYKLSTHSNGRWTADSNSDINIFIRCKSGTVISIRYINGKVFHQKAV